jgi:hypothetical protein
VSNAIDGRKRLVLKRARTSIRGELLDRHSRRRLGLIFETSLTHGHNEVVVDHNAALRVRLEQMLTEPVVVLVDLLTNEKNSWRQASRY